MVKNGSIYLHWVTFAWTGVHHGNKMAAFNLHWDNFEWTGLHYDKIMAAFIVRDIFA